MPVQKCLETYWRHHILFIYIYIYIYFEIVIIYFLTMIYDSFKIWCYFSIILYIWGSFSKYREFCLKNQQKEALFTVGPFPCPRRWSASIFLTNHSTLDVFFFWRVSVFLLHGLSFWLWLIVANPYLTHL